MLLCEDRLFPCDCKCLNERTIELNLGSVTLESSASLAGIGKSLQFPGARGSTSMVFFTDVKEETQLGPAVVYSALSR